MKAIDKPPKPKSSARNNSIQTPAVYHADQPNLRLDLVAASPELMITQKGDTHFHVALSHTADSHKLFLEQETPSRYRIIEFPESLVPLRTIMGKDGITVPTAAKNHLVSIIQKASPMLPVHSEIEFGDIPSWEGDPTPIIQMTPFGAGLKIALLVRPCIDKAGLKQGPYFRPGQGRSSVMVFVEGQNTKVNRDLTLERKKADAIIKSCAPLKLRNAGTDEWEFDDSEDCLETLSELQTLSSSDQQTDQQTDHQMAVIEWPEGQKFTLLPPTSFKNLKLKIAHKRDWFEVEGSLALDENTVLGFQQLLTLLDQSDGRFIRLDTNKFVALSAQFKKQLQELKVLTEPTVDGCRIHNAGSMILKEFANNAAEVEADKKWKDKIKAFAKAEKYQPELPKTFQADLRDYQREGFDWVSRLSFLGLGACLADDMGLGKTVQALAVLVNEAAKGPCLVVAPTSVCHNWTLEMQKFAPTLNPRTFDDGGKRADVIASLTEMDVLICSYTLLQQEADLLASKDWQVIVLDEAQSIKNASTKRFQAAIRLQGQFRLALTGTPIENHLEEIWSLFRFLVPGLLGSRESFQKRFLSAPDKDRDKTQDKVQDKDSPDGAGANKPVNQMASQTVNKTLALRNLLKFFILRRTKNAVLLELPPRTEQTILIEMSPEELAFYEALRRRALMTIAQLDDQGGKQGGKRKIHILAEITRLRRACCHPSLVTTEMGAEIPLASSKMKAVMDLVDELLENNHQALVFSQYVGYLDIVRRELDTRGIAYQYLDGSTPALERQKQVKAFQAGESPLFLLSLKAGGTGLNLTAADYVIHLDPWWNPAVEDQASDRAHRMGQQRPVTIYRMIMHGSIEEKIVEFHQQKRDMVNELLEGTHTPEKMSEDDLLRLMGG